MSIVTKKGDSGITGLANGKKVSKADPRIDALGTLDELVSFLGLARAHIKNRQVAGYIKKIQVDLFSLGSEIALAKKHTHTTSSIEKLIARFEHGLPKGFIIPGKSKRSAYLDVARSVCRRLERRIVILKDKDLFKDVSALKYINRLSDLLWIFARIA